MNKKFTFIIPNYNKGKYISDCLNSVYNQTYKNFEIIVIDDGSTDDSLSEIKKFPIDVVLNTNRKQAGGARNLGLKYASGEYIVFLDSDDYLTNEYVLEHLANKIKDEDVIFLNYTVNKEGKLEEKCDIEGDIGQKIENTRFLGCPTKCFKKDFIKELSFPENKRYEDIIFTLESLCKCEKSTTLKESFFTYRIVQNSNITSPITEETMIDIFEELFKMYRLCLKYPKYKQNLMNRLKRDRLSLRLEILNKSLETGINTFREYF